MAQGNKNGKIKGNAKMATASSLSQHLSQQIGTAKKMGTATPGLRSLYCSTNWYLEGFRAMVYGLWSMVHFWDYGPRHDIIINIIIIIIMINPKP